MLTNPISRYPNPEGQILNRVILVSSVVQRETTITITVSTGEPVSVESKTVRVVSLNTTEITGVTRFKIRSLGWSTLSEDYLGIMYQCDAMGKWTLMHLHDPYCHT